MGARDTSKPKQNRQIKTPASKGKSEIAKETKSTNAKVLDLAKNVKTEKENKTDSTASIREKLYLKSLEIENIVHEPCSLDNLRSESNVSKEQDSDVCTTKSQVQGDTQISQENKEKFPEIANSDEKRGQNSSNRVNQIGVIKLTGNPNNSTLQGKIGELDVTLLIDTGATVTCLSYTVWNKLSNCDLTQCNDIALEGVNGQPLDVMGRTTIALHIQDSIFHTSAVVVRNLSYELIIGRDFISKFLCCFDLESGQFVLVSKESDSANPLSSLFSQSSCNSMSIIYGTTSENTTGEDVVMDNDLPFPNTEDIPSVMNDAENEEKQYPVYAGYSFVLPPQSETIIEGKIDHILNSDTNGIVTTRSDLSDRYSIIGAAELVKVSDNNTVPIRLMNPTAKPVKVYRRTKLAQLREVDPDIETFELKGNLEQRNDNDEECEEEQDYSSLPDISKCAFTEQHKGKLRDLLYDYRHIFATRLEDLGRTNLVQHYIDTGNQPPIKQRPYRTSPDNRKEIDRQVQEMCDQDIAQPSVSSWSSPVVLVKKKDGKWRFCVDYRKLNAITRKDSFPLPLISDVLDSLSGTQYFTSLDMKSGYWQLNLDPATKDKSAFVTHNGLYEFNVLPFGLTNSPASFQRLMGHILRGLEYKFALIYIDDIIIFSKSAEEHLAQLREVFSRLDEANLKLNPAKCEFAKQQLEYLGHIVTPDGIKPCASKIQAVEEFPIPKNLKQLRSFLGLANYYRRFIKDFAKIARPLNNLTKKSVKFEWNEDSQNAFDKIKRTLVSAPILVYPDFTREFHLFVDASSTGMGMALAQIDDNGRERVVAYNGRNFNKAELNYSTTHREGLALVEAIKKFQPYLHGKKFTVHTDHSALQWLMTGKHPLVGKLARWALLLQQFNFDIVYRSGKTNGNADGLSRREYEKCELYALRRRIVRNDEEDKLYVCQRRDRELSTLVHYLETSELPENDKLAKSLLLKEDQFYIGDDGLLYHLEHKFRRNSCEPISQLVIPEHFKFEILSNAHDHVTGGHLGTNKTYQKLRARYWWRGMFKDTEHWCKSCVDCSMRKTPRTNLKAPLIPIPVEGAFDRLAVDVVGPLTKTTQGNKYILVFSDYLTRWPEAFAIPNAEASTIARILVDEIIGRHGAPRTLLSDRGTNFLSSLVAEVCKLFRIRKSNTSSYRPQTDGLVERFNGTLIQSISMFVNSQQTDWDTFIPSVLFAYRVSPSEATQETPFYLLYGREARLPIDVKLLKPTDLSSSVNEHRQRIVENIERSQNIARENIQKAQQKMKSQFDKRAKDRNFRVGDQV